MIVDGKAVDVVLNEIAEPFSHGSVNRFIPNPTYENIAKYIWDKMYDIIVQGIDFEVVNQEGHTLIDIQGYTLIEIQLESGNTIVEYDGR
jgi:6-pyruvoyl-tetrahydropterin synthase